MNNEIVLSEFMQAVWNDKDFDSIPRFVSPEYTIFRDNADPWEGKTLNHEDFKSRLNYSFEPLPDIHFDITAAISDGDMVAITWMMTGTNTDEIGGYLPTHKCIQANGMTIYHFNEGKVCGHTQVYDRTTIMRQLGFISQGGILYA